MRYKRKQLFILLVLVLLSILLLTSMALAKNLNYTIEELENEGKIIPIHDGLDEQQFVKIVQADLPKPAYVLQLAFQDYLAGSDERRELEYAKINFNSDGQGKVRIVMEVACPDKPFGGAGYAISYKLNDSNWIDLDIDPLLVPNNEYVLIELGSELDVVEGENSLYLSHVGTIWGWPIYIKTVSFEITETNVETGDKSFIPLLFLITTSIYACYLMTKKEKTLSR